MKYLKLFVVLLLSVLLLCACNPTDSQDDSEGKIKVLLTVGEGITVTSENPVYVNSGDTATFDISLGKIVKCEFLANMYVVVFYRAIGNFNLVKLSMEKIDDFKS